MTDDTISTSTTPPAFDRAASRATIFSANAMAKKSIVLPFYGAQIELRQPAIGELEGLSDGDTSIPIVNILVRHAYVPGTDEKMFDFADTEQLKLLPFNDEMKAVSEAIGQLTNVQVSVAEKN